MNYSTTEDSSSYDIFVAVDENQGTVHTFGKFQSYPDWIFNPEFCGVLLWELVQGHILNEYKICQFHQIRSGIIMYGCEAYVFTPISNNDLHSNLKILLRKKPFKHNLTPIKACRQVLLYCREQCKKNIIPCVPTIQKTCMKHLESIMRCMQQIRVHTWLCCKEYMF